MSIIQKPALRREQVADRIVSFEFEEKNRVLADHIVSVGNGSLEKEVVMNHQFNWWFDYAPIRGLCLQRLKGGCLKHLYRLASKKRLSSSIFSFRFFFLLLNVFLYRIFCDIAYCCDIISSGPKSF